MSKIKIDELRAAFPKYADVIYEDCCGSTYVYACHVYNGSEDLGGWDEEAVPDGSESQEQQDLAALVDYVRGCEDCCGCGGW